MIIGFYSLFTFLGWMSDLNGMGLHVWVYGVVRVRLVFCFCLFYTKWDG